MNQVINAHSHGLSNVEFTIPPSHRHDLALKHS